MLLRSPAFLTLAQDLLLDKNCVRFTKLDTTWYNILCHVAKCCIRDRDM